MQKSLRILRILLAVVSFTAVLALFVDVTGYAAAHWAWMAGIQLVPALLALNVAVVAVLVALTLIAGRVYCSVVCPLGIYQDIVNRVAGWFAGRKKRRIGRFRYAPARRGLRMFVFCAFVLLIVAGFAAAVCTWVASFVEPYSAFGRMATWLARPGAVEVNNLLADAAAARDSYAFAHVANLPPSLPLIAVAAVTFVVVTLFAATSGRAYCNEICPVGTLLGFMSRHAWLRPEIDLDKCNSCGSCARHCKASCIDPKAHAIDYSRCVACMDCMGHCSTGALTFTHKSAKKLSEKQPENNSESVRTRRAMLAGGAIVAGSLAASALGKGGDGGFAPLKAKQKAVRKVPVTPPGAKGARWLASHCISCQLCIAKCPNGVLSPSTDLSTFMQPVMDFSSGWCRPECTSCSDVCPADAILPIDRATKSSTKIGTATVDFEACISAAYGQSCGKCASGCPAGAIEMVRADGSGNLQPVVDESACIGCGACEYHCPVGTVASNRRDRAAIHVEGVERHSII